MFANRCFAVVAVLLFACQSGQQEPAQAPQRNPNMPQMKKIAVQNSSQVDSLVAAGLDVIVVEDDYMVARIPVGALEALAQRGLAVSDATESDLVQRLVNVTGWEKEDLTRFSEMGLDIWEVKGDVVIAQAYDKFIRQLQNEGFGVEVVLKNALDVTKATAADK